MPLRYVCFLSVLLSFWMDLSYADQSKAAAGADSSPRVDQGRKSQDAGQARRDDLREAVKSQDGDMLLLPRQLTPQEKALLRQQLRQQRLNDSK
jgi:hypothetical protein